MTREIGIAEAIGLAAIAIVNEQRLEAGIGGFVGEHGVIAYAIGDPDVEIRRDGRAGIG
jgi:hypothetical protein